jgi:hypothetical protein
VIRHGQASASTYDHGHVPASINIPDNFASTPNDRASCAPGAYNFSFSPNSYDEQEERYLANLPPSPNLSNEVDEERFLTPSPKHSAMLLLDLGETVSAQLPATPSPPLSRIQQGHKEVTRQWNVEWHSSPIAPSPSQQPTIMANLANWYDALAEGEGWVYDEEPISKNCRKRAQHAARRAAAVGKFLFRRKLGT